MQNILRDVRYSIRRLLQRPGFAAVAIITLALGIGANTAIFSVVNGVLLRPLPYAEPERIVRLFETVERATMANDRMEVAPANFLDWQAQSQSFSGIAAYGFGNLPLAGEGGAEIVSSAYVSANLFSVLGVSPLLGRPFTVEEDDPQNEFVAVLSHGLWQRRFGGDPKVLGRTISLDGRTYTIIGVMPPSFRFPKETALWTPLALNANQVKMREARFLKVVARLKPGVSLAQARAELNTIAGRMAADYPQTNQNWGANVVALLDEEVGKVRRALLVLFGIVALVLLIACVNIASLLLARAATYQSELAIRLALGATRLQIIRQLLTESLLLALIGGGAGLLLALWGIDGLLALAPDNLPRLSNVRLDGYVLGFTLLATILTGVLFGLLPALQASKLDLNSALKEGGNKTSSNGSRNRTFSVLVTAEIALALVVLVSAGLLINSFLRLRQVDSGLNVENVLTVRFTPPSAHYNDREHWRERRLNFYQQLLPRVTALPGVEAVGAIDSLPLSGSGRVYRFRKEDEAANTNAGPAATFQVAMTGYFRSMGIALQRGRLFTEEDREGTTPVVVINETMARRFWPDANAIGQRIVIRNETFAREIIGVVQDVKHFGLDKAAEPEMYVPFNQMVIDLIPLVIRTKTDPLQLVNAIKEQVHAVDPAVAIAKNETMRQVMTNSLAQQRFTMLLLAIFAIVALLLSALGIYGVMAYSVAQRTHEIGIRVALGAQAKDVLRLFVGQGVKLALSGVTIGLLISLALTQLMQKLLFGISATDPVTFVSIALLLTLVALIACYVPARRATKVDPIVALRCE